MKKIFIIFLISVLFFVLDNAVMPFLAIKTVYPSLLVVFIICYSISSGSWKGLWLGVFSGFLQDIYFSNVFWVNSFSNMVICVVAGFIGNSIFKERKFIPVISCFFLVNFKFLILFSIMWLSGVFMDISNMFFSGIYSTIVCIFMYKPVYRLSKKSYMKDDWKF